MKAQDTQIALLRGINLGGRRLPMKELAAMFEDAGCREVRTYIQSGNVVYQAAPALARRVPALIEHVGFLRDRPSKSHVAALDPDRSPPDEFIVRGGEIYLRCPNGVARSKLTSQYFDSRLKTISTARNWRTVLTLQEMARTP